MIVIFKKVFEDGILGINCTRSFFGVFPSGSMDDAMKKIRDQFGKENKIEIAKENKDICLHYSDASYYFTTSEE